MAPKVLEVVFSNTFTLVAARRRVSLLKEFLESVFFGKQGGGDIPSNVSLAAFLVQRSEDTAHVEAMQAWGVEVFRLFTPANVYTLFEDIFKLLEEVPVLTLYTSVPLPKEEYEKLCKELRVLSGRAVLIDDKIDSELPAGSAFVWNGVYHDHSIRRQFKQEHEAFRRLITTGTS
jgi:hypothetical protein